MLLNPNGDSEDIASYEPQTEKYMPILDDDDITPGEVLDQIDKLNSRKVPGCDGLAPGIMKFLSNA